MPQCKPGDLAVVITEDAEEFNCGLVVEVLRADNNPWNYTYLWEGPTWWVRCSVLLTWLDQDECEVHSHEGPMPDNVLLPIRGPRAVPALQGKEFLDAVV